MATRLYVHAHGASTLSDFGERYAFLRGWREPIPDVVIFGPRGSGKLGLANAWLSELFGAQAGRTKLHDWSCQVPGKTVTVTMVCSPVHTVLDPTSWGQQDRHIILSYARERCGGAGVAHYLRGHQQKHVLLVRNADALSRRAQRAVRLAMDEFGARFSVLLLARSLHRLDDALVSRCRPVRKVADQAAIQAVLDAICASVGRGTGLGERIARESFGDWRGAMHRLQLAHLEEEQGGSDRACPSRRSSPVSLMQAQARRVLDCVPAEGRRADTATVRAIRAALVALLVAAGAERGSGAIRGIVGELMLQGGPADGARLLEMAWEADALMCRGTKKMVLVHLERFVIWIWSEGLCPNGPEKNASPL